MTPLEQNVLDGFRHNGDRFFRRLPDWPNTEISIGDVNRLGGEYLLQENGRKAYPRVYHHRIQLHVDSVIRAHTLIGQETMGDAILVDAELVAERKADGKVYRVSGWRHYHDEAGRWIRLVMKTEGGHWLTNRCDDWMKPSIAAIRRSWRQYHAAVPKGLDWMGPNVVRSAVAKDVVGRHVDLDDAVFSHLRVVEGRKIKMSFLRDDYEVPSEALQASDGRWLAAGYHYVHDARAEYEKRIRDEETASDDPFAVIDADDAGAFAPI